MQSKSALIERVDWDLRCQVWTAPNRNAEASDSAWDHARAYTLIIERSKAKDRPVSPETPRIHTEKAIIKKVNNNTTFLEMALSISAIAETLIVRRKPFEKGGFVKPMRGISEQKSAYMI